VYYCNVKWDLATDGSTGQSRFDHRQGQEIFLLPLCPDQLWGPPSPLYIGHRGRFPRVKRSQGVTLNTHPHIVPRSRMSSSYGLYHVKWVHCHHAITRPVVADRGDGFQVQRVAANILNKQSQTADSGWSSCLGVGRWTNNHHAMKLSVCYETLHSLGAWRIVWNNLSTGTYLCDLVHNLHSSRYH
jgi:hypothetical protein